jgi:hypothetical protein
MAFSRIAKDGYPNLGLPLNLWNDFFPRVDCAEASNKRDGKFAWRAHILVS